MKKRVIDKIKSILIGLISIIFFSGLLIHITSYIIVFFNEELCKIMFFGGFFMIIPAVITAIINKLLGKNLIKEK